MEDKNVQIEEKLYSTHIFILPFKILENKLTDKNSNPKYQRKKLLLKDESQWIEYDPVNSDNPLDKTLMRYLNKYAKDSLFKYGSDENNKYVMELHNTIIKNSQLKIEYLDKNYELKLESVKVKFFDTSVGTISFIVNNYKYPKIEDVLLINNQGRKIYPAYEGEKCSIITISEEKVGNISCCISKADIKYINEIEHINNELIGYFLNLEKIEPILDDRMYTISHYLDENLSKNYVGKCCNNAELNPKQSQEKYWYQYIFVDEPGFKMCQDEKMENELLEKATYTRWRDLGTLFGISRYSFVLWTNDTDFNKEHLNNHIKNHYFQLVNFVIAQKSTIVLLNEQINNILDEGNISDHKSEEGKKEYQEYLLYLSKLSFKEITCQEQGIELYNLCRQQMGIEELTEELDIKIKTLNERAERIRDDIENENDKKLNYIGMVLAVLGSFFGVLGIGEEYIRNDYSNNLNAYGALIKILKNYSYIVSACVILGFIITSKKVKNIISKYIGVKNDYRK